MFTFFFFLSNIEDVFHEALDTWSLQTDQEFIDQVLLSSVGCSNDERYNEEWKAENYIMVTLLSVIGTFMIE